MSKCAEARLVLVVAMAKNRVIGLDGGLPWHISSDLKFFRATTMGKPMIMGRKTYESIGKPLDGRDNIVVTRNTDFAAPGILVAGDMDAALDIARDKARARGVDEIAVIGGAEIYAQTLPLADVIVLTEVHAEPDGDTYFPALKDQDWTEISRTRHEPGPKDSAPFSIVRLERVR